MKRSTLSYVMRYVNTVRWLKKAMFPIWPVEMRRYAQVILMRMCWYCATALGLLGRNELAGGG